MVKGFKLWLTENDAFSQFKTIVPNFPDYVIQDMLMKGMSKGFGNDIEKAKAWLEEFAGWHGYQKPQDIRWKQEIVFLDKDLKMFEPESRQLLSNWLGGEPHGNDPESDSQRYQYQRSEIKKSGESSNEPIILAKTSKGYKFIEGKHRIVAGLEILSNGFNQAAWVLQSKT